MKIVTAKEMSRIEQMAYAEGASEEDFMNKAGRAVAGVIQRYLGKHHLRPLITLLCGKGNNAGDAFVAGTELITGGFQVEAYSCFPLDECSKLCQLQAKRFQQAGGVIHFITSHEEMKLEKSQLLVDGLLGTGFKGEVHGILRDVIEKANASKVQVVAIDIPSGIDGESGVGKIAIKASLTCFLGLPKIGCFLDKAWNYVGSIEILDFGLGKKYIEKAHADFVLIEEEEIKKELPELTRVRHKYEAGLVVGLSGSPGMPGAAILTSDAVLKAGAGMVRLLHPAGMEAELSGSDPEIIRIGYKFSESKKVIEALNKGSGIFVGPGVGTSPKFLRLLEKVLPAIEKPCVIDAEALTLIAENYLEIPKGAILTPHLGECRRLLKIGKEVAIQEVLQKCKVFVEDKKVTLVLKGAPTFIFHPKEKVRVSSRGDPGMATAGSGDVLTGIIAAFLAQKKEPFEAAKMGVYLHGMAGERAAEKLTSYSMVASDITSALPDVFKELLY